MTRHMASLLFLGVVVVPLVLAKEDPLQQQQSIQVVNQQADLETRGVDSHFAKLRRRLTGGHGRSTDDSSNSGDSSDDIWASDDDTYDDDDMSYHYGDGCASAGGIDGIESATGKACCLTSCGQCGGDGCSSVGAPSDCCVTDIVEGGEACSKTGAAPCYIDDGGAPAPAPSADPTEPVAAPAAAPVEAPTPGVTGLVCPNANDIYGLESSNGKACCVAECGICGGAGCSTTGASLGLGADDCCEGEIVRSGQACSEVGAAPCYINDDSSNVPAPTPTPVAAPVSEPTAPASAPTAPVAAPVPAPMAAPVEVPTAGGEVCSLANDIPGIQSSDGQACCSTSCGQCGGVECSSVGAPSDCCVSDIVEGGEACSEAGAAPCYIDDGEIPAPTPSTGTPVAAPVSAPTAPVTAPTADGPVCSVAGGIDGVESSDGMVCCLAACGQCGGVGCSSVGAASDCCTSEILELGKPCSVSGTAPCYVDNGEAPAPTPSTRTPEPVAPVTAPTASVLVCANAGGIDGIESSNGKACCLTSCGQCGGDGCSSVGAPSDCCVTDIVEGGEACSKAGTAPCYIDDGEAPAPTPSTRTPEPVAPVTAPTASVLVCASAGGIDGIESSNGKACCLTSCGQCGGDGCSSVGAPSDCCVTDIVEGGEACSKAGAAPCYIDDGEAPAPTPSTRTPEPVAPVTAPTASVLVCANAGGIDGIESSNGKACCLTSCGQCGGDGCSSVGAPWDCCVTDIVEAGEACSKAGTAPCYIDDGEASAPTPSTGTPQPVVAPVTTPTADGPVCSVAGGIDGVESSDGMVCCLAACGQCGGVGCSSVGAASDCCTSEILELGKPCSVSGTAPCYVDNGEAPAPTPSTRTPEPVAPVTAPTADVLVCANAGGIDGIESSNGKACCLTSCGQCGGDGCSSVGAPSDCCVTDIVEGGEACSKAGTAPCYIDDGEAPAPTPSTRTSEPVAPVSAPTAPATAPTASGPVCSVAGGIDGVESSDGRVCCLAACGQCGGVGCSSFGAASDCCMSEILEKGESCSVSGTAPCYVDGGEASSPTPSTTPVTAPTASGQVCSLAGGIAGIQSSNGQACCSTSCEWCGGVGCSEKGASDCCVSVIVSSGEACSVSGASPCFIDGGGVPAPTPSTGTPEPVPAPTDDGYEFLKCNNGVEGIQSESCFVCCPESCGVCGGETCESPADRSLGPDECCESNIRESEALCIHTGVAPCVVKIEGPGIKECN